jgi:Mn2+/Fe2+ NRAMP family transporter
MQALFLSAVIDGIVAVPTLVIMTVAASRRNIMGPMVISLPLQVIG